MLQENVVVGGVEAAVAELWTSPHPAPRAAPAVPRALALHTRARGEAVARSRAVTHARQPTSDPTGTGAGARLVMGWRHRLPRCCEPMRDFVVTVLGRREIHGYRTRSRAIFHTKSARTRWSPVDAGKLAPGRVATPFAAPASRKDCALIISDCDTEEPRGLRQARLTHDKRVGNHHAVERQRYGRVGCSIEHHVTHGEYGGEARKLRGRCVRLEPEYRRPAAPSVGRVRQLLS